MKPLLFSLPRFRASHGERMVNVISLSMRAIAGLLCGALFILGCGSDPVPDHNADVSKKVVSLDLLGILHEDFPCEKYLTELEDADEISIGYLANTFGNSRGCLSKFLTDHRLKALRVHTANGPCVTHNRCDSNEPLYRLSWGDVGEIQFRTKSAMRDEAQFLNNLSGNVVLYLSPILEHKLSIEDFEVIGRAAQEVFPGAIIVDNPVIARTSRFLPEFHGIQPALQTPYGYSIDGYIGITDELLESNNLAAYAMDWALEFNGICLTGPWVSPLDRRCF